MIGFTSAGGSNYKGFSIPDFSLTAAYSSEGNTDSLVYIPLTGIKHISFGYYKPTYISLTIELYDKNGSATTLVSDSTRNSYSGSISRDLDGTYKYIRIYAAINGQYTATAVIRSTIASA